MAAHSLISKTGGLRLGGAGQQPRHDSPVTILYEDGTRCSNRKVPRRLLGGLDGDAPARGFIIEQDHENAWPGWVIAINVVPVTPATAPPAPCETSPIINIAAASLGSRDLAFGPRPAHRATARIRDADS
jgi:hypothetical protein